MMNIDDVKKVICELKEKPFICGNDFIETDSGYVITKKAEVVQNDRIREKTYGTSDRNRRIKKTHN